MRIRFTKMHGAGNDFVVLNETRQLLGLNPAHYRWLAHRHLGIGADQILSVRPPSHAGVDFDYVIHNADGQEVEHCGNGARCFARYVHAKGLSTRNPLRVQTQRQVLELREDADGQVTVDMGVPFFDLADIPFVPQTDTHRHPGEWDAWSVQGHTFSVLSMGNPHVIVRWEDVMQADLRRPSQLLQSHAAFPQGVNVGFLQVNNPHHATLRVIERGVGETLACGTGACAAAVTGLRRGWLRSPVQIQTRGGMLHIVWESVTAPWAAHVHMSGPATTVFEGEVEMQTLA